MNHSITFIVPVRHQSNSSNWALLKSNLSQTLKSISSQDCHSWNAVIVANEGADLPSLPERFEVKRVEFPPNDLYRQGPNSEEEFHNAVRIDKGRRILAGLLHATPTGHVMVVDDDDFVSRRIASFAAANPNSNGWFVRNGYVWTDGSRFLYKHNNFMMTCGTSLIIRADLYNLPNSLDTASSDYIMRMLGSHIFPPQELAKAGHPLAPLPFPGAIYRTGHPNSHSRSKNIFQEYFLRKSILTHPWRIARQISRIRFKNAKVDNEFFGVSG